MPWLTNKKTGKPFNTDWIDEDEKKKEQQIADNKKVADELNGNEAYAENGVELNGKPGSYNLFRSGNLDAPNGMIFLSTTRKNAEFYGDAGKDMDTYQLDIKNPLVIDAGGDVEAVQKAWKTLHPDKELKLGRGLENKWTKLDKENSTALQKSDYDALLYKINGKVTEVQLPGKQKDRLKKVETKLHPGSVTMNAVLPKAREIVHAINDSSNKKSKDSVIKSIISSLDSSKYDIEYKSYMDAIIVTPKNGTDLEKVRGEYFMKVIEASNGRYFVKGAGANGTL